MPRAPGAVWTAISGYYSRPAFLTVVNGLAFVYSLPLIFVAVAPAAITGHLVFAPPLIALLLGIMPNPAAAGLHLCAREITRDDLLTLRDVQEGLRRLWKPALALYAFSAIAFVLILVNIIFYAGLNSPIAPPLEIIWVYLLFTWLAVQMYLYPMLLAVEQPSVPLVYRNAFVLAFKRPISTLVALIAWLAILILCSATGLVIVLGLIIAAMIQHTLVQRLIPTLGTRGPPTAPRPAPETKAAASPERRRRQGGGKRPGKP